MKRSVRTSEHSEGWQFSVRGLVVALAVTGLMLLATRGVASAGLRVCNNSGSNVDVAIAYVRKDAPGVSTGGHAGVTVEGWWSLSPAECAQLSSVNTARHWTYFYAESARGGSHWGGNAMLCVSGGAPFTRGDSFGGGGAKCPAKWRQAGFKRIDTDKSNYKLTLNGNSRHIID